MGYTSVAGESCTEQTIEKSRFITYTAHVGSEEEARAFLARVRESHPLATHVCYGFVADSLGNVQRFSDDGEPQGTAGLPILGVIKAKELKETAVAVVRYFGGIKLGAGGLVRAYSSSAAAGCAAAEKRRFEEAVKLRLLVDYPEVNAALRFLEGEEVVSREYGRQVVFGVVVRGQEKDAFISGIVNALNGRIQIEEEGRFCHAFALNTDEK